VEPRAGLDRCGKSRPHGDKMFTVFYIKYGLFISHNTTSFIRYLFKLTTCFGPCLGHLQVTSNVCLEEVIQVSPKIKYVELKFNEVSSFIL